MPARGATSPAAAESPDWAELWDALARLERLAPGTPDFRDLAAELAATSRDLEEAARRSKNKVERFRARVLSAHVARIGGTPVPPAGLVREAGKDIAWGRGEPWLAARVLVTGPVRYQALVLALEQASSAELAERVVLARVVLRHGLTFPRLEEAERLARKIDALAPTSESAGDLARVLALRGETLAAEDLLTRRSDRSQVEDDARTSLLAALGEIRLGAGRTREAIDTLGSAFARGSVEAGLLLARQAFVDGAELRARALYRSLAGEPAGRSEALRGWGLAGLPAPGRMSAAEPNDRP